LHDRRKGIVENTAPAFAAAIAKGYGIECDLRPAANGLPIVFHDETLTRLVDADGSVGTLTPADLKRLRYRESDTPILTFGELLELVDGATPLLVEIKSEWDTPDVAFLSQITALATAYKGPIALMSFDPEVMYDVRRLNPQLPRGIVSGSYHGDGWWDDRIPPARGEALSYLWESGPVQPHFYAYEFDALPTAVTEYVRRVQGLPVFTWTVRTQDAVNRAAQWADAMIFEGFEP
jgi:glycerophosphoryl diester phosphodiesterase